MAENVALQTVFPPVLINKYIIEQLKRFGIVTGIEGIEPIVPVQSTSIDDLFSEITVTGDAFLIAYDRLIRYNSNTAYWNKREQLVYTIHSSDSAQGLDISRVIIEALDREDAAAQDVNTWVSENSDKFPSLNVFFHNFRVFQIDETRDILELGSVKFNWRGKIIIEYDYHTNTSLYN
jgi:hypothetical protein